MRILNDTNVIMDYIADRKPFSETAYQIIELFTNKKVEGCIAEIVNALPHQRCEAALMIYLLHDTLHRADKEI